MKQFSIWDSHHIITLFILATCDSQLELSEFKNGIKNRNFILKEKNCFIIEKLVDFHNERPEMCPLFCHQYNGMK